MDDTRFFETVDGVIVPRMTPGRREELKAYPLRSGDVFIATYPRSGTTWTQHIVRLLRSGGVDDGTVLDVAVPWLDVLGADYGNALRYDIKSADLLPSPRSLKTHLPYDLVPGGPPHTTPAKYIYVARNPKDVCVSYWHFTRSQVSTYVPGVEDLPWEQHVRHFLDSTGIPGRFGGWFDHVCQWWEHRTEPNILFLKYEDMKREPRKKIEAIAEFIDVERVTPELIAKVVEKTSFSIMRENPAANKVWHNQTGLGGVFLRKGMIGDWKTHFTAEQNSLFEETVAEKLSGCGLEFDYD